MGAKAVDALREGQRGMMVALQSMRILTIPLAQVIGQIKPAPLREFEIIRILAE
jgi:6-phosphofructokinase